MTVIVLIRRCVRPDKEAEFLASYSRDKPVHKDFIEEALTKVNDTEALPEAMRSLSITEAGCVTYLNVAKWKSAKSFEEYFNPSTSHDSTIETSDRLRIVLDLV